MVCEYRQMQRMRRLTVAVVTMSLLGVSGASAVAAQSPSPSPADVGQRVEVPEAGFALTYPGDWQIRVDSSSLDSGSHPVVTGRSSGGDETCDVYLYGACSGEPFEDCAVALDEFAARMVATYESYEDFEGSVEQTPIASAAEYAVRLDIEWTADAAFGTFYVFTDGTVHDTVLCRGSERPDDRWLSIAETFEFLTAAE